MNENNICIEIPSFIRLFVIRRIIDKHIKNSKNQKKAIATKEIIKDLDLEMASGFKDNEKYQSLARNIVTRLIKYGIKKFMSKDYNEKEQANIIEDIFNKIISKKFGAEYYQMIEYKTNSDKTNVHYYQNLLFNSIDLMNQIFQYLEWGIRFDGDLYSCSLVNSHWLYHVWNPNSVYHVDFNELFKYYDASSRKWTRIWQRLYNVKSVYLRCNPKYHKTTVAKINHLSMFGKVEKVNVYIFGTDVNECISAIQPIMSGCNYKDRIKCCRISICPDNFDSLNFVARSSLRLPKAQCIEIGDLLFYRQWTNECTQLTLSDVCNINTHWCKFVIESCDCSNITKLMLNNVTFDSNSINCNKVILKQFALKFYNLKTLAIHIYDSVDNDVLLFLQLLKQIISKNKTKVELKVNHLRDCQRILLTQRMIEKNLKINKLIITSIDNIDSTIQLIQEGDSGGLNHLVIEHSISGNQGQKLLDVLKCKSVKTFEVTHHNIKFVNSLLKWKMIVRKQLFVIVDVYGYHDDYNNSDQLLSLFKQLYKMVYQLFVKRIALDIKITFKTVKDSKVLYSHLSLYSSCFENSQFLSQYNSPKCNNNNLCSPRDKPYTYFYMNDSKKSRWYRYFVFGASNVRMK